MSEIIIQKKSKIKQPFWTPVRKKITLIIIAALAGLLLAAALGVYLYFISQFITYQDDHYQFSIKYPNTWKLIIHPKPNVPVVLLRPKDTVLDPFQGVFTVTVQDLPKDITSLDSFSHRIKKQMTGVFGKSITIAEDKPIEWGWRQGHEMVFEAPVPDHLKMVNVWVFRSDQVFILTFIGDMNKYYTDVFYIDEMIHSLALQ